MLAVLALVVASVRVATGLARPGTWVRPMSAPSLAVLPNWRREPGEDVYSFADERMVIDLHERR
jgi:hypothetical protein